MPAATVSAISVIVNLPKNH